MSRFGWRPSLPDLRNKRADLTGMPIKDHVDPRDEMPDPYEQGELGSCTAQAYAGAVEYDDILNGGSLGTPSRLAIYYGERVREGTVAYDAGAEPHDAFKDGRKYGVGPEDLCSYEPRFFRDRPSAAYEASQSQHKVPRYVHPAQTIPALKRLLSNQQTVVFGFTVYESFESIAVEKSGKVPVPAKSESVIGGHAVLLVGYLEGQPEYFLCRNSWGTEWGLGGYFLFPTPYLCSPQLCSDFRSIYRPA